MNAHRVSMFAAIQTRVRASRLRFFVKARSVARASSVRRSIGGLVQSRIRAASQQDARRNYCKRTGQYSVRVESLTPSGVDGMLAPRLTPRNDHRLVRGACPVIKENPTCLLHQLRPLDGPTLPKPGARLSLPERPSMPIGELQSLFARPSIGSDSPPTTGRT